MLLVAGVLTLASCDDDNDSNPTLIQPTEFVLNQPTVANGTVDLAKSTAINLTWSQPKYTADNAPVIATYSVQVSSTGTFNQAFDPAAEDNTGADYVTLDETTTVCSTDVPAESIAKALQQINNWEEGTVIEPVTLSLRIRSVVKDAGMVEYKEVNSNVVNVKAIPYYVELKDADPLWWHLIGGDIADGAWGDVIPTSLLPMQPQKGYEFDKKTGEGELTWTGYLAGNGFKLKQVPGNWDNQWGGSLDNFVENDGGSSDIKVETAGYYTVTLNTKEHKLSVNSYTETVKDYEKICITGSFNEWGMDDVMNPVHTYAGAKNHDWWIDVTLTAGSEVKFNIGNWDANWGGVPTRVLTDGLYGYGASNGDNIVVPEDGDYTVIFNDITGYYRFIKK